MTVNELLKLIPAKTFRDLAVETKVDAQVKKLSGEVMFKLILFSMLSSDKLSLRVMETFLQSARFKSFSQFDILESKYNSIRDRICTINAFYFEKLFEEIFAIYNKELKEENALSKTDSTYVALATKLFSGGMKNGDDGKRFVKYSVNLKGSIPSSVKVHTEQSYISEELALAELINGADCIAHSVVVFDRGLQSRNSFDKFTNTDKLFVSRANLNIRCKVIATNETGIKPDESTVTIISDDTGFLINRKEKKTQHTYRVIKGIMDQSKEEICFVTNILDEDCYTIAQWYKQRWEIETFFKFIKQHLNVKHLVSRNENGIKVMIYMTMILAILIIAYKKINAIKGFKIAKLKFEIELENEIIKTIVTLCGGDPGKAPHLFSSG
ncbi:MAG: IS4 family transposase [Nitrososphaerales archaeon]